MCKEISKWVFLTKTSGHTDEIDINAFGFTEFEGTREQAEWIVNEFNKQYEDEYQDWGNTWGNVSIKLLDRNEYTDEVERFIDRYLDSSDNLAGDLLESIIDDLEWDDGEEDEE